MSIETFDLSTPTRPTIIKDPAAVLDYSFDWSPWLADIGETIIAYAVTPTGEGLTVSATSMNNGVITAWVAGGTVGKTCSLMCHIVTPSRTDERTIYLQIRNR